jgi:hypothetical protein
MVFSVLTKQVAATCLNFGPPGLKKQSTLLEFVLKLECFFD